MYNELDHFLALDASGIKEYSGAGGLSNRIAEWLSTPVHTVADNPDWGHNLRPLWHDPESPLLTLQLEMAIARKLPRDVRDIRIRRVGAEFTGIDRCVVSIEHDMGVFEGEVAIEQEGARAIF